MNYPESLKHNLKCLKNELKKIDKEINYLRGQKNALKTAIGCIEIIIHEQNLTK